MFWWKKRKDGRREKADLPPLGYISLPELGSMKSNQWDAVMNRFLTFTAGQGEPVEINPRVDRMSTQFVGNGFTFEVADHEMHSFRSSTDVLSMLRDMFSQAIREREMARSKPIMVKDLMDDLQRSRRTKERIKRQLAENMDRARTRVDSSPMQEGRFSGSGSSSVSSTSLTFLPFIHFPGSRTY